MSYKQNSSRLRRLHDFFGITDSSGLTPLSQIRDNGIINNGRSASTQTEKKPSVVEQLKSQSSSSKKTVPSKKHKEEVR